MGLNLFNRSNHEDNARIRKHKKDVELELMADNAVRTTLNAQNKTIDTLSKAHRVQEKMLSKFVGYADEGRVETVDNISIGGNKDVGGVILNFVGSWMDSKFGKGPKKFMMEAYESDPTFKPMLNQAVEAVKGLLLESIVKSKADPAALLKDYQTQNK